MMQDIGDTIRRALVLGVGGDASRQLLPWLAAQFEGSRTDWDDGAGDAWGCVLVGSDIMAYLFMKAPIAILSKKAADRVVGDLVSRGVMVVRVDSMDAELLCSDRGAITQLAGGPVSEQFDHGMFSANDLVWATV